MLSAGKVADITAARALLAKVRARYVIADEGYDANALRALLRRSGSVPVIPGRRNRKCAATHDKTRYRDRHLIENTFCRLKDFRRIAILYDNPAANLLFAVSLATLVAFWI